VCQFCGARLKPLVRPPTGGLSDNTDWGAPSPSAPPPSNDDWLSSLSSNDTTAVSSSSSSGGNVDDWLSKLRAQDEAEEESSAPAAQVAPSPAPAASAPEPVAKSRSGGTDWLGALRASTDQLPSWLAEPVEPGDEAPEDPPLESVSSKEETWIHQPAEPTPVTPPPASSNLPSWLSEPSDLATSQDNEETLYAPAPGKQPQPASELPSWMNSEVSDEPAAPAEPPPAEQKLPDWLGSYTGSSEETIVRRASAPLPKPQAAAPPPASELPDWMKGDASPTESSDSALPEWMRSAGPDDTIAAAPSDLPDWLKSEMPSAPASSTASAVAPEPPAGLPSWLDDALTTTSTSDTEASEKTVAAAPDELPDWLKSEAPAQSKTPLPPPAEVPASSPKSVVGITDWFESEEANKEKKPAKGISDWLKNPETTAPPPELPNAPGGKSVVGVTDWLSAFQGQANDDDLDWLKPPEPSTPANAPPATPGAPAAGTTEWLNSMGINTPPKKTGTGELPKRGTGWLGSAPDAPPDAAPKQRAKPGTDNLDWLKDSSPQTGSLPTGSEPAIKGLTGWLSNLQEGPDVTPPPPTAPADASGNKAVIGTTDWLASLSGEKKSTGKTGWLGAIPSAETPPTASEDSSKALLGSTDWLSQLAASAPTSDPAFGLPAAETPKAETPKVEPEWMPSTSSETKTEAKKEKDWVPPGSTDQLKDASAAAGGKSVVGTTDWLREIGATPGIDLSSTSTRKNDVSDLDWLNIGPATPAAPAIANEPAPAAPLNTGPSVKPFNSTVETGELPGWLAALKPDGIDVVPPSAPPSTPPASKSTAASATETEDLPDWMQPGSVQKPAFTSSDETMVARPRSMGSATPAPATPASVPAFINPVGPAAAGLTSGQLPQWLNALRPLDARATAREPEPDHEEATGPLAGMRGVLPAESIISMAGRPGVSVTGFLLTDAHTKLAENLRHLVQEEVTEEAEVKPRKRTRLNFSFSRLIVAVVMLFMIIVPFAIGPILFPPPAPTVATDNFYKEVNTLPANGSVVLLAVDYDPAFSGELNPAVSSVIVHLMNKGARVLTVSTTPAGAGIAQKLLADAASDSATNSIVAEGKNYINLGYVPGSLAGLRQFAIDPIHTIAADYNGNSNPFERDVLVGFEGFNNINLIIVATASADTMRSWIEQVGGQGRPMVAITSASAAPLVSPYAFGTNPQLKAMITGLPGALEYDTITGRIAVNAEYPAKQWSAFGLSLYATAGLLGVGMLLSLVTLLLNRRPKTVKAAAATATKAKAKPAAKRKAAPATATEETYPSAEPEFSTSAFDDNTFSQPTFADSEATDFGLETMTAPAPAKTKAAQNTKTTKTAKPTKTANAAKTTKSTKAPAAKPTTKTKDNGNSANDDTTTTKPRMRKV
jgi:hypothetical protein